MSDIQQWSLSTMMMRNSVPARPTWSCMKIAEVCAELQLKWIPSSLHQLVDFSCRPFTTCGLISNSDFELYAQTSPADVRAGSFCEMAVSRNTSNQINMIRVMSLPQIKAFGAYIENEFHFEDIDQVKQFLLTMKALSQPPESPWKQPGKVQQLKQNLNTRDSTTTTIRTPISLELMCDDLKLQWIIQPEPEMYGDGVKITLPNHKGTVAITCNRVYSNNCYAMFMVRGEAKDVKIQAFYNPNDYLYNLEEDYVKDFNELYDVLKTLKQRCMNS